MHELSCWAVNGVDFGGPFGSSCIPFLFTQGLILEILNLVSGNESIWLSKEIQAFAPRSEQVN